MLISINSQDPEIKISIQNVFEKYFSQVEIISTSYGYNSPFEIKSLEIAKMDLDKENQKHLESAPYCDFYINTNFGTQYIDGEKFFFTGGLIFKRENYIYGYGFGEMFLLPKYARNITEGEWSVESLHYQLSVLTQNAYNSNNDGIGFLKFLTGIDKIKSYERLWEICFLSLLKKDLY